RHGNDYIGLVQNPLGRLVRDDAIGKHLSQAPAAVVLHLVNEGLERIAEDAQAYDALQMRGARATAPWRGCVALGQWHGAEFAGGGAMELGELNRTNRTELMFSIVRGFVADGAGRRIAELEDVADESAGARERSHDGSVTRMPPPGRALGG